MGSKGGRPSVFDQKVCDEICLRLVEGESLRRICQDEKMPHIGTVLRWVGENTKLREQYTRARELQAEVYADEITQIADDGQNDTYTDDEGNVKTDHDVIARSRLRVDSRKWIVSKLLPKKYGDKLELAGEMKQTHEVGDSITNLVANLRKTRGK